jgi:hypothetical protein
MAEPTQALAPKPTAEPRAYRPLAPLAVAGFGVAALFTAIFVVVAATAWYTGTPMLDGWLVALLFVLAVAGFGLSLAGWLQVRRADGTRSGQALAAWGMRLCGVLGVLYGAYLGVTEVVVRQQARDFADNWLEHVKAGDLNYAFVYTVDPARRQGIRPDDAARVEARFLWGEGGHKGVLPAFRESELVRAAGLDPTNTHFEYQGVNQWKYQGEADAGGYAVEQMYRMTTPEGTFDVLLPVAGIESRRHEFSGRQWSLLSSRMAIRATEQTPLGKEVMQLRLQSGQFVGAWAANLAQGKVEEAYLDTCESARADRLRAEYPARLAGAVLALGTPAPADLLGCAALADPEKARELYLPGYADFVAGKLVHGEKLQTASDNTRQPVLQAVVRSFRAAARGRADASIEVPPGALRTTSPWRLEGDEFHVWQPIVMQVRSQYRCDGTAEVVTDDPAVIKRVRRLTGAADAPAAASPKSAGRADRGRPRWYVRRLDLGMGGEAPDMAPGGVGRRMPSMAPPAQVP